MDQLLCRHGVRGFGKCQQCESEYQQIISASSQAEAESIAARYTGPVEPSDPGRAAYDRETEALRLDALDEFKDTSGEEHAGHLDGLASVELDDAILAAIERYGLPIPGESVDPDDDPECVCGVYRSEHSLCGCPEGFQTAGDWAAESKTIAAMDDWEFERVHGQR